MRGDVTPSRPAVRKRPNLSLVKFRLIAFLSILGPGFITANVDNDPGGILTYSQAGAKYGYTLLWTLIPTTIALIVVQEMAARMGAVTGKGLSDLIREEGLERPRNRPGVMTERSEPGGIRGIAAEVARIAGGSGMRVLAWNRTPKSAPGLSAFSSGSSIWNRSASSSLLRPAIS